MALTEATLNQAADAIIVDTIKLHSGDPGAAGTTNEITGTSTAIVLGAATGGVRSMAAALNISVPAGTVSHYTLWQGTTLRASKAFGTAKTYANPGTAEITTATLSVANAV